MPAETPIPGQSTHRYRENDSKRGNSPLYETKLLIKDGGSFASKGTADCKKFSLQSTTSLPDSGYDMPLNDQRSDDLVQKQLAIWRQITEDNKLKQEKEAKAVAKSVVSSPLTAAINTQDDLSMVCGGQEAPFIAAATPATATLDSIACDLDSFCQEGLQHPDLIREQQQIFDQIRRERQQELEKANENSNDTAKTTATAITTNLTRQAPLNYCRPDVSTSRNKRNSIDTETQCSEVVVPDYGGSSSLGSCIIGKSTTPSRGTRIRVVGTQRAYKSISKGTAKIVKCLSCGLLMQVGPSAKLVYCTNCDNVSPIDMAMAAVPRTMDKHIARRVQQQELRIAHAEQIVKDVRSSQS